ncbi:MAG: response regulator [Proteobacteria bacterium]|nr:response regulator [Pseudomonadota bacterium]
MSRGNILVIDDEKFFRTLYEEVLTPEGYVVCTAESGKMALNLLREQSFDVVLADMVMPEWDGIRTMEEIKKLRPDQEVIIVTHVSALETAIEAMKSGASDYIMKPIVNEDLFYSIRRLLKRQKVLEEHARLVEENIEFFEILSTYKRCLDILSNNRYGRLVDVIVEGMMVETGATRGAFWTSDGGSDGNWKCEGTTSEETKEATRLPADDKLWQEKVKEGMPFTWPQESNDLFFVPLMPHAGKIGVVELSSKRGKRSFDERDLKISGVLAEFSQVALNNAFTLNESEDSSFKNEDYGVYTFSFFKDYLAKQIYVASRYNRPFSIVCLKIDNWKTVTESFSVSVVRSSIRKLIAKVLGVLRDSDVVAYDKNGLFYMLLAETDYFGSIMALQRIEDGLAGFKYVSDGERSIPLEQLTMSASYPRDGADIESMIANVTRKAEDVSESLFQHLELVEKSFWESVASLFKHSRKAPAIKNFEVPPYVYETFHGDFCKDLLSCFADEVTLRPSLRGVIFVGVDTISPDTDFCKKIAAAEGLATRVFLVGKRGDKEWDIPNITPVYLDEKEKPVQMILSLTEEAGYVFLGLKGKDSRLSAFHSPDIVLVEKLITKLRDHYLLQWI